MSKSNAVKKVLNKGTFIDYLKNFGDLKTKVESERCLDNVLGSVQKALSDGYKISFIGFGTFEVKKREERDGHNPKTGKKIKIPAYMQPTFRAGAGLKDSVNKKLKGKGK